MASRLPEKTILLILEETKRTPSASYNLIAEKLRAKGVSISGSGVRKIWEKRGLAKRIDRYAWIASGGKE